MVRTGAPLRVGVFGGTFDPPHDGHLVLATEVARAARLDRVLWVPAAVPPHKAGLVRASAETRARLVRAAIQHEPRFRLCTLELERGGVSYTVDTLRALRAAHPGWRLSLALGADQMARFSSWKEPEAVAELAQLIVAARPGFGADGGGARFRPRFVRTTRTAVSSTLVRERARRGVTLSTMVTAHVLALIHGEGLYGGPPPSPALGRQGPGRPRRAARRGQAEARA